MRHNLLLTVTSLLSILLFSIHVSDDIVRGFDRGGLNNLGGIAIMGVWLWGTFALAERRSGLVIVLVASLLAVVVPVIHWMGAGLRGELLRSSGALLYVWTLYALGATGAFGFVLALQELLRRRRVAARQAAGGQTRSRAAAAD